MSRATAAVAAGCAAISAVLMVVMCGLFALIRQYRELTFPAGLLLGCAAVVLGWIAFRGFTRPDASARPPV